MSSILPACSFKIHVSITSFERSECWSRKRKKKERRKKEERKARRKRQPPFLLLLPLDRAKHGNEGRWRPPPSPSPVGSHISSSSWPLKFMSTVVTRFISGREESHGYFYMLFARGCIHPRPGVVNATGCLEREEWIKLRRFFFSFFFLSFFFFLNGIVAGGGCALAMRWWRFVTEIDRICSSWRGIFIRKANRK